MVQYHLVMDAWMREAQEASGLLEDIEISIQNSKSQQLWNLKDSAKSKLLKLGVMLDRLESLLHNPPSKPALSRKEVDMRWKMLSDTQLRTRVIALTLFSLQSPDRLEDMPASDTESVTNRSPDIPSPGDPDKSTTSDSEYDPELLRPLVRHDSTEGQNQIKRDLASNMKTLLWKACRAICLIMMAIAVLFAVLVLCAVI